MKESYVSYECAKRLKELGFNYDCRGYYHYDDVSKVMVLSTPLNHNNKNLFKSICSAPRLDEAQKWLREVKGIAVCVFPERYEEYSDVQGIYQERLCGWDFEIWNLNNEEEYDTPNIGYRESYESALSAGLNYCLTLFDRIPCRLDPKTDTAIPRTGPR